MTPMQQLLVGRYGMMPSGLPYRGQTADGRTGVGDGGFGFGINIFGGDDGGPNSVLNPNYNRDHYPVPMPDTPQTRLQRILSQVPGSRWQPGEGGGAWGVNPLIAAARKGKAIFGSGVNQYGNPYESAQTSAYAARGRAAPQFQFNMNDPRQAWAYQRLQQIVMQNQRGKPTYRPGG